MKGLCRRSSRGSAMIVKGIIRKVDSHWLQHLTKAEDNEYIRVIETRDLAHQDIDGALREMDAYALGTKCKKPVFSLVFSPAIPATNEDFDHALALVEEQYPALKNQPRIIIEHIKNGIAHRHVEYARCSLGKAAIDLPWTKTRLLIHVSLPMFDRMGIQPPQGALEFAERHGVDISRWQKEPSSKQPPSISTKVYKTLEGAGLDPITMIAQLRACKGSAELMAALAENGLILAQGDKAPVIATADGTVIQTAGRLLGLKAKEVRERLLPEYQLPSIETIQNAWANRTTTPPVEIVQLEEKIKGHKASLRRLAKTTEESAARAERQFRAHPNPMFRDIRSWYRHPNAARYKGAQKVRGMIKRLRELRRQERVDYLSPWVVIFKDAYRRVARLAGIAKGEENLSYPPVPTDSVTVRIVADQVRRQDRIRGNRTQLTGRDRTDDRDPPKTPPRGPKLGF